MYTIGGYDKSKDTYFSDVLFLEIHDKEWFLVPIGNRELPASTNHSSVWDQTNTTTYTVGGKGISFSHVLFVNHKIASGSAIANVFALTAPKSFVGITCH